MRARRGRLLGRRAVALKLTAILLIVIAGYWCIVDAPLPFNETWWRQGEKNYGDPFRRRHRIADWLILWGSLKGWSRADVVALLGEPTPTEYFREWNMVYILGRERGFIAIDSEWLVLRLDSRGRVQEAQIVSD